jgi:hypothetical protein
MKRNLASHMTFRKAKIVAEYFNQCSSRPTETEFFTGKDATYKRAE